MHSSSNVSAILFPSARASAQRSPGVARHASVQLPPSSWFRLQGLQLPSQKQEMSPLLAVCWAVAAHAGSVA